MVLNLKVFTYNFKYFIFNNKLKIYIKRIDRP